MEGKGIKVLSNNKKLIAVIGATGQQGGGVVRALQASGLFKVRALTRNPDKHRELAEASLRRLRVEIVANRATVADIKDYHVALKARLDQYLRQDPKKRDPNTVQVRGLRPAFFERTAWELALITQSLAYTDPQVAQALSRVYTLQEDYAEVTRSMMQARSARVISTRLSRTDRIVAGTSRLAVIR